MSNVVVIAVVVIVTFFSLDIVKAKDSYYCKEYAYAEEMENDPLSSDVIKISSQDKLTFPGVDSCVAALFVLDDGSMVGGHIGMMTPYTFFNDQKGLVKNVSFIVEKMLGKVETHKVKRAYFIGNGWHSFGGDNASSLAYIPKTMRAPDFKMISTEIDSWVADNVIVNNNQLISAKNKIQISLL